MAFTTALVTAGELLHAPTVTTTEYVPLAAVVAFGIFGFCILLEKPLGPVHEYVAPEIKDAVSFKVSPLHLGPLFPAMGDGTPIQLPHISHQAPFLKKLKHLVVVLKISNASAGFAMAFRSASVIRGTSIPLVVLLASSIADESAGAPLALTATPPCAKRQLDKKNARVAKTSNEQIVFNVEVFIGKTIIELYVQK
jgi:hypothetical protein